MSTAMTAPAASRWTVDRALELVAFFAVVASLVGLVAALAGVFHAPQVLLLSLLLTGAYAWKTRLGGVLQGSVSPRWQHVLLLIAVALFFRLPAYNYILGGQDEGLYTNIGQYIEHTGGIKVHDDVAQRLAGSPYLKPYLQENRFHDVWGNPYLLGVYSNSHNPATLEFQFYHVFPVWIALFAGLFGSTFGVYALTFLALLSIIFFYRLALVLTASHGAALFAGLLLALSPLHAFFSKFPVSEVPALAFTLIGFTYAAAYWSCQEQSESRRRWLVLSAFAFLCMFTIRMSGFTYMPFFVGVAFAALACDGEKWRRRDIQLWAGGVVAVFLLSAWYGFHWAHQTVIYNYGSWFKPFLGTHWLRGALLLIAVGLVAWVAIGWWASRSDARRGWLASRVVASTRLAIGPMTLAILVVGAWYVYRLAWTGAYRGTSFDSVYHIAGAGWGGAVATSLPQLVIFLGPLLVVAFLIAMARRWPDPRMELLRLFLVMFFAYAMLLRWVLPYNPYYARFLVSELAPYLILFVVCVWAALKKDTAARTLLSVCFVLSLTYAGVLSAAQIGKNEEAGLHDTLARLVAPIGPDDLILLDVHDAGVLKTPLVYTFGRHVVTVGQTDLADAGYMAKLASAYANTWLITPALSAPDAFTRANKSWYRVVTYKRDHFAPLALTYDPGQPLFLYELTAPKVPVDVGQAFGTGSPWLGWLTRGWSGPEPWGVWSAAETAELRIDPRSLPASSSGVVLHLQAQAFIVAQHPCQRVIVVMNDVQTGNYHPCYPTGQFQMTLQIPEALIAAEKPIVVTFELPDAQSPQSLGLSNDGRKLGISLTGFEVSSSRARN